MPCAAFRFQPSLHKDAINWRVSKTCVSAVHSQSKPVNYLIPRRQALLFTPVIVSTLNSQISWAENIDKEAGSGAWAEHDGPFAEDYFLKFNRSPSGLRFLDKKEGSGEQPVIGETVKLHYSGYLIDGTKFDTSYRAALFPFSLLVSSAPPVAFKLEKGSLIPGFLEAVLGMKVGGRRIIQVPASLAYGERGAPGIIPPNATLVFFIELRRIGSGLSL